MPRAGKRSGDILNYTIMLEDFFDDPEFPRSYHKLLWLYLLSRTDFIGIHQWGPKLAKAKTDLTKGQIGKALVDFEAKQKIFWVDGGSRIWLPSKCFLNLNRGKASENQLKAVEKRLKSACFSFVNGSEFVRLFAQVLENKYSISIPMGLLIKCNVIECNVNINRAQAPDLTSVLDPTNRDDFKRCSRWVLRRYNEELKRFNPKSVGVRLSSKIEGHLRARFAEGVTLHQCHRAIFGCFHKRFNRENGYLSLELIFRNGEKLNQYLLAAEKPEVNDEGESLHEHGREKRIGRHSSESGPVSI